LTRRKPESAIVGQSDAVEKSTNKAASERLEEAGASWQCVPGLEPWNEEAKFGFRFPIFV